MALLSDIVDQLAIELKKIKTVNGYSTNVLDEAVIQDPDQWKTFALLPCVTIAYGGGSSQKKGSKYTRKVKTIRLLWKLRDDGVKTVIKQIGDLENDIEQVLAANPLLTTSLGEDLVIYTKLASDRSDKGALNPFAIWYVDLEIVYHEKW